MKEKKRDWKFIIGMTALLAVFAVITVFFWRRVAYDAALEKAREAQQEKEAVEAIYVYVGDMLKTGVLVDMKTEQVFTAPIPKDGIVNRNGTMIEGDVLEEGDMVRLYGDGQMSDDPVPVYANVTKMQRTGRATLEQAEEYRTIAEEKTGSR
ncbi:MAG: hypothetical protein IJX90_10950 [Blautia sp.]|nr:hypothetical protein [Blautia sp.]